MQWTFKAEYVRCGKGRCRCCPHGPYWYGYVRVQHRTYKRYFGKRDPRGTMEPHPWDAIFLSQTASERLACDILGIDHPACFEAARAAYLRAVKRTHPDTGGSDHTGAWTLAAWSWLRVYRSWP